ncbi:hypothetical protein [Reyranella sp.]|uniref:hypothetical protein n=1 Tax=Reyranella sp. TaxID=1929291 RepID=UPI001208F553|nr:hypothetical protein [Reyranella sp.]TAJ89720.1 MAG: hypothetical protein EPO50_04975 [Reyranella sp.]
MKTFTAGRFRAECYLSAQNGQITEIVELHRNGSDEVVGRLNVSFDDLPDLEHVLKRAIAAQNEAG